MNLNTKKNLIMFFLVLFITGLFSQENPIKINIRPDRHDKQIVAYYPNWQWYRRNQLVNPQTIDYSKYTVINYAFFRPLANGTIQQTDSWADESILLGPMVWWPVEGHDTTLSLPYLCHQSGVKLLPSIGGWNDSVNFPVIAASSTLRETFVQSCLNLISTYDFDGIDLDWEYPGFAEHNGTPADAQNYTQLLTELRNALDQLGTTNNRTYLLSSCFGASQSNMQNIEWNMISNLVDMINLMTYDFHGPWDNLSNHHTPLYSPAQGDPLWCVEGAFNLLTQTYNVPAAKINIGMAFYGKALAGCHELFAPHTGYDTAHFSADEGQPHYYTILQQLGNYEYHWDDQVKCPYLTSLDLNSFITYDNETSIMHKAQFVNEHQAQGVIIWELTGDYLETFSGSGTIASTPLVDMINDIFNQNPIPYNLQANIFPDHINLNWQFANNDPNNLFKVYRNNQCLTTTPVNALSYSDYSVLPGHSYSYKVTHLNGETESEPSDSLIVNFVSITDQPEINQFLLMVYPNPFQKTTVIKCKTASNEPFSLDIYNIRGQRVRQLWKGQANSEEIALKWNRENESGKIVSSGIYYLVYKDNHQQAIRKLLLTK